MNNWGGFGRPSGQGGLGLACSGAVRFGLAVMEWRVQIGYGKLRQGKAVKAGWSKLRRGKAVMVRFGMLRKGLAVKAGVGGLSRGLLRFGWLRRSRSGWLWIRKVWRLRLGRAR